MEEWGIGESERQIEVICLGVPERHKENVCGGSTEQNGESKDKENRKVGGGRGGGGGGTETEKQTEEKLGGPETTGQTRVEGST